MDIRHLTQWSDSETHASSRLQIINGKVIVCQNWDESSRLDWWVYPIEQLSPGSLDGAPEEMKQAIEQCLQDGRPRDSNMDDMA